MDSSSRSDTVIDMVELMAESHLLWNEPEFTDFPFPVDRWQEYVKSTIEQIQAEESENRQPGWDRHPMKSRSPKTGLLSLHTCLLIR